MALMLVGLAVFVVGVEPDVIGMDRSPVVGFVQIGVWLTGSAALLLGAYSAVRVVRNSRPSTLQSEIGLRLIATGYVVAATASLADFLGIGSHRLPLLYFGPVQIAGLIFGAFLCIVGLLLFWPPRPKKREPDSHD
jgi:hypothetical protein